MTVLFPLRMDRRRHRVYVYALVDPRDRKVRYIGRTNNPRNRLLSHLRSPAKHNKRKHAWIGRLAERGLIPELRVLETCQILKSPKVEAKWIDAYRAKGVLYNGPHGPLKLQRKYTTIRGVSWYQ